MSRYAFGQAIADADPIAVIAEIKRRSPSKGTLLTGLSVKNLAIDYASGGATCLSVLTEPVSFGGSPGDISAARRATQLPVLRKDFLAAGWDSIHADIKTSTAVGADAMLVIVAELEDNQMLRTIQQEISAAEMDTVVEVQNETELALALGQDARIISINQRHKPRSSEFTMDYHKAKRISQTKLFDEMIDSGVLKIAASGIGVNGGTSLAEIVECGYDAALIGEALLTALDPQSKLVSMLDGISCFRAGLADG